MLHAKMTRFAMAALFSGCLVLRASAGGEGNPPISPRCSLDCGAQAVPDRGLFPLTVAFSSGVSSLGCSEEVRYEWDFGDGSSHDFTQNPSHTYEGPLGFSRYRSGNQEDASPNLHGPALDLGGGGATWTRRSSG